MIDDSTHGDTSFGGMDRLNIPSRQERQTKSADWASSPKKAWDGSCIPSKKYSELAEPLLP